jgi:DNA-binding transcriptional ArsR family regulator
MAEAAASGGPAEARGFEALSDPNRREILRILSGGDKPVREIADAMTISRPAVSRHLKYHLRAIDDLHAWLKSQGDWVLLGAADESKPAADGTVEAWGRSPANPVGGWYGLRKGYRGRFGMYLPPLLEALGLAEVTHDPRNNKMRAMP